MDDSLRQRGAQAPPSHTTGPGLITRASGTRRGKETWEYVALAATALAAGAVVFIAVFVFWEGWPALRQVGVLEFVLGKVWSPTRGFYGVLPMIAGTFAVTILTLILAIPVSVGTAVFLTEYSPEWAGRIVRKAVDLLAGIPSVVYGLFGMTTLVPLIRRIELAIVPAGAPSHLTVGYSVLAASIVLAVMIAPTVISISCDALKSVPSEYREGSLGLGATKWQTVTRVVLPVAAPGILAGIILGTGRAVGETMAVLMVAGNAPLFPTSVFAPVRTLTANIAAEIGYATGLHEHALFADGIVLFSFVILLNSAALWVRRRAVK